MRVIDTDVLIEHFHNVQAATDYIAHSLLADGELFIASVSVAEILAGMRPGEEELTLERHPNEPRLHLPSNRIRQRPRRDPRLRADGGRAGFHS